MTRDTVRLLKRNAIALGVASLDLKRLVRSATAEALRDTESLLDP